MNARPVTRYRNPRYPTRLEVLADHTLLEKHLPPAWKSCAEMAGVVTLLLASNNCTGIPSEAIRAAKSKPAVVAPIFEHGEGRGATGCIVVNPPVFLSEQDAMQVIREELRKAGVATSRTNVPVEGVRITPRWSAVKLWAVPTPESKPFALGAFDPQKRVGVEYVNRTNYFDLGGERSMSTVQAYDFEGLARTLSHDVRSKAHNIYFGAFYDPATVSPQGWLSDRAYMQKLDAIYKERDKASDPKVQAEKDREIEAVYNQKLGPLRAESSRQLRLQVKDFIDWLKGQGVI
jgi:hypothetical protein